MRVQLFPEYAHPTAQNEPPQGRANENTQYQKSRQNIIANGACQTQASKYRRQRNDCQGICNC